MAWKIISIRYLITSKDLIYIETYINSPNGDLKEMKKWSYEHKRRTYVSITTFSVEQQGWIEAKKNVSSSIVQ